MNQTNGHAPFPFQPPAGQMPNMETPSLEQQIAMQKMQRHLDQAKERLTTSGYQPLDVVMTPNGPLAYGVLYNLAGENNELEIVFTPLEEEETGAELPLQLAMVQLKVDGMIADHDIKQLVLVGMAEAEGVSVLETAGFIQEAQLAQQIGVELTMMLAAHKEGQIPDEALDNSNALKQQADLKAAANAPIAQPGQKTTPGGIILP